MTKRPTVRTLVARWPLIATIPVLVLLLALMMPVLAAAQPEQAQRPDAPEQSQRNTPQGHPQRSPIVEQTDIVYATHDGVELLGDMYSPRRGSGPFPAVLMVHGGGWRAGSKASFADLGRFLARNGYVAFSVTYRLHPGEGEPSLETSTYPQNIWDVKAAVQFMRGEAEQFRIDPERIAATGSSAGGHLVAMLGLTGGQEKFANPYDDEHADQPDNVDVIVPLQGVMDMVEQWESDVRRRPQSPIVDWYLGGPLYAGDVRARYFEASPVYHASTENAEGTAWLIVWGTEDTIVTPEAQSWRFHEDLKRAGATVRIMPVVGEVHFSLTADPGGFDFVAPRILAFLDQQLGN